MRKTKKKRGKKKRQRQRNKIPERGTFGKLLLVSVFLNISCPIDLFNDIISNWSKFMLGAKDITMSYSQL